MEDPMTEKQNFQRFRVNEVARSFPDTAETLLLDTYLTDEEAASARVFRVYRETPAHYHIGSDEYLYVLSGRGMFWMGDAIERSRVRSRRLTLLQAPRCSRSTRPP